MSPPNPRCPTWSGIPHLEVPPLSRLNGVAEKPQLQGPGETVDHLGPDIGPQGGVGQRVLQPPEVLQPTKSMV
jgi:hypothetical protein